MKIFITVFTLFSSVLLAHLGFSNGSCLPDWESYRDMKCIKILGDSFVNYESAKSLCAAELPLGDGFPSSMLTIQTENEQKFIHDYIFGESEVINNVWLSAHRNDGNDTTYTWSDGTTLNETYSNWGDGNPIDDPERLCVEMKSNYSVSFAFEEGQWFNIPCRLRNLVVCENLPLTSLPELKVQLNEIIRRLEKLETAMLAD